MDFEGFRKVLRRLLDMTPEQMVEGGVMDHGTEVDGPLVPEWNWFRDAPVAWLLHSENAHKVWPLIASAPGLAAGETIRGPNWSMTGPFTFGGTGKLDSTSAIDPYVFVPGEYVTRDGRKAVVLCDDAPGGRPLIGYVDYDDASQPYAWAADGLSYMRNVITGHDLVAPETEPEQVVRWATLYPSGTVHIAERPGPAPDSVARARVVLTPGRFADENTPSEWDQAIDACIKRLEHWPTPITADQYIKSECIGILSDMKRDGK